MAAIPRDIKDLYLAPVVLSIDALLEEFGRLGQEDLLKRIHADSRLADGDRAMREAGLIQTLRLDSDTHGWEFLIDERGVRLRHAEHTFVLGIPNSVREVLDSSKPDRSGEAAS